MGPPCAIGDAEPSLVAQQQGYFSAPVLFSTLGALDRAPGFASTQLQRGMNLGDGCIDVLQRNV